MHRRILSEPYFEPWKMERPMSRNTQKRFEDYQKDVDLKVINITYRLLRLLLM